MTSRSCVLTALGALLVGGTISTPVPCQADCAPDMIDTIAGNGDRGYSGDGDPATEASLYAPLGVAVGADGSVYIADTYNCRIRKVDPAGIITTVAGNGERSFSGDGGPAAQASLDLSWGLAVGADGSLYIADTENLRVRKVDPSGIITTVAGDGHYGYSGDGGPTTQASLAYPMAVAVGADGSLYIADLDSCRIRRVDLAGIITTVAGNGDSGYSGDGGPATEASLQAPCSVAVGADGSLYIADSQNWRIRRVDPGGIITTVAGNGEDGYWGDGGPATEASLALVFGVAVDAGGDLFIADSGNGRIRRVGRGGVITTMAGNGGFGYSGDGGPAAEASLFWPHGVGLADNGGVYIADSGNSRIRKVWPGPCCSPEYEPSAVKAGEVVTFHGNASPPAAICEWDFGDGTHGGGCDAAHVYSSAGAYLACVTVTDDQGASHTCCTSVEVTCECSVAIVGPWCHMASGQVGQTKPGQIGAWNASGRPCDVALRVTNGVGAVVFETEQRLQPFCRTRFWFIHTFTPEEAGRSPWTWEVWPVECDEQTPCNNVFRRPVTVIMGRS